MELFNMLFQKSSPSNYLLMDTHLVNTIVNDSKNTNACKRKNDTCWNYSKNQGGEMKENDSIGKFMYDIFDTLKNLCKCYNVPPSITTIKGKI
jgi:hypothetical protein